MYWPSIMNSTYLPCQFPPEEKPFQLLLRGKEKIAFGIAPAAKPDAETNGKVALPMRLKIKKSGIPRNSTKPVATTQTYPLSDSTSTRSAKEKCAPSTSPGRKIQTTKTSGCTSTAATAAFIIADIRPESPDRRSNRRLAHQRPHRGQHAVKNPRMRFFLFGEH